MKTLEVHKSLYPSDGVQAGGGEEGGAGGGPGKKSRIIEPKYVDTVEKALYEVNHKKLLLCSLSCL